MQSLDIGCGYRGKGTVNIDLLVKEKYPFKAGYRYINRYGYKTGSGYPQSPNFIIADAAHLPFRGKVFRTTFCYHVLEHIRYEDLALSEMDRVTNGVIDVRVPYVWMEYIVDMIFFWMKLFEWKNKYHLREYNKKVLKSSLKRHFKSENIRMRYGYIGLLPALIFRSVRNAVPPLPFPWEVVAVIKNGCE